jgi:uncharacterized membrane protein YagU involved in acid resistance
VGHPGAEPGRRGDHGDDSSDLRVLFQHELAPKEMKWAVPAVHYSVGAGFGFIYGLLARTVPGCTCAKGTVYGTAVWLAGDEVAVPLLGLAHGPAQTSLAAHANALGSHLVYGLVTHVARKAALKVL